MVTAWLSVPGPGTPPSYSSPLPLSFCNMNSNSTKSWGTPETWEQSPKTSPSP